MTPEGRRTGTWAVLALGCTLVMASAAPAAADWTRVTALPANDVFAIRVLGDTIAAGVDTATYVSVDAGATWRRSAKVAPGVSSVGALWIRNGRVYAGTFGQGVFVSDDLGASWQSFNQGLVGGVLDSQLDLADFEVRNGRLYAATFGAGVYERDLAPGGTWHPYGDQFEPNQASNVNDLVLGGTRLLAGAGANGMIFRRDPADVEWTLDFLVNGTLRPGLTAESAIWTGSRFVLGTSSGVFVSPDGAPPWTLSPSDVGHPTWSTFAQIGTTLIGAFDGLTGFILSESQDDGASWTFSEFTPQTFAYMLAAHGGRLYAARSDGLWVRTWDDASVNPAGSAGALHFSLAQQPVHDEARFRFELPQAGEAVLEIFDVAGRRAAGRIIDSWSAGPHERSVDARALSPGVYLAVLTSGNLRETLPWALVR